MSFVMNPNLRDFWATQSRYKILYGGRSSGKSWDTGAEMIKRSRLMRLKILCTRQFQANIKESVYTLLKDTIYRMGIQEEFTILHNTIRHNATESEFIFLGIARNIEEIKSLEGVDIMWVEESTLLTKEQWDIILPTIRKERSEIILVFNPRNRSDFVWQRFVEHPHKDSIVRSINYDENQFLSETIKAVIKEAKEEDFEEYEYIYLGKPKEGDEKALFAFDEVEKAMDNSLARVQDIDLTGVFSYGVDVARYGNDKSVITKRKGFRIYSLETYSSYSTSELANKVNDEYRAEESKTPNGIFIDTIGVGAGVYDKVEDLGLRAIEANASMRADKTDLYYNKRAEMYFNLRDWIRKGGIIPKDDDLKEELLAIRYSFNNTNGKIIIQPKEEIKELLGRSPDKSDSIALHFFSEINTVKKDIGKLQRERFKKHNTRRFR